MRRFLFVSISLVVLGFLGLLGWGLARQAGEASPLRGAPDFTFTTFKGETISLTDLRGRPVVLNFWASWCIPCREEAPALAEAWRTYKDKGVVFLGVNIWDEEKGALSFLEEFSITYPNGPDRDGRITTAYRVTGVPETFFISREGKVVRRWLGALSARELARFVEELQ
ncbi:MAG: ccmG [Dehalococcoidia bacterium]|nr:ccmG [Dehalococcoidia bacterium]